MDKKIFKLLYKTRRPLSAYRVAKKMKIATSSARYFLKKMCKAGVVVEFRVNNVKLYGLHPLFFDDRFWKNFINRLKDVMSLFYLYQKNMDEEFAKDFDIEYALKLLVDVLKK